MSRIYNFHCRRIEAPAEKVGQGIATLAQGTDDVIWPWEHFDRMEFDGPLQVGSQGGHGVVRYAISEYIPGRLIKFEFNAASGIMKGFRGFHWFEVIPLKENLCEMRHMLIVDTGPVLTFLWGLLIETLHDATVEAALAKAELAATGSLSTPFQLTRKQKFWRKIAGENGRYDDSQKAAWMS